MNIATDWTCSKCNGRLCTGCGYCPTREGCHCRKKNRCEMDDWPLFSPRRIMNAIRLWCWFITLGEVKAPLWTIILYYRRPQAGEKKTGDRL